MSPTEVDAVEVRKLIKELAAEREICLNDFANTSSLLARCMSTDLAKISTLCVEAEFRTYKSMASKDEHSQIRHRSITVLERVRKKV